MTVIVAPLDAVAGAPLYTSQQLRETIIAAVAGGGAGRPLGGRSGFRPGQTNPITSTSTVWSVGPCAGLIDTLYATNGALYPFAIEGSETGALAAADGTNSRIDGLYLVVDDNALDSSGFARGRVVYVKGVAGSPSVPAGPTGAFLLGTINVPAAGGGNPSTAINRRWIAAAGGRLIVESQAQQDELVPFEGMGITRADLDASFDNLGGAWVLAADAAPWTAYTPTWSGGNPSVGQGSIIGRYKRRGRTLHLSIVVTIGANASGGAGAWSFSLPTGCAGPANVIQSVSGQLRAASGRYPLAAAVRGSGTVITDGCFGNGAPLDSTTALSLNDQIVYTATIETASAG